MRRELAERLGESHDHATLLEVRRRAIAAVRGLALQVVPGMAEDVGLELARRALRAVGFEADWVAPDVREIFDRTSRHWRETHATGTALYGYAAAEATTRGWQLDLEMAGHRLGAYPHTEHHNGALASAEFTPSSGLWMLEIQLRRPDRPYSDFFEDLLLDTDDA